MDNLGLPFHQVALSLDAKPVRMEINADGRRSLASELVDSLTVMEAGVAGYSRWNHPLEAAYFYFTSELLAVDLGDTIEDQEIRTTASFTRPMFRAVASAAFEAPVLR